MDDISTTAHPTPLEGEAPLAAAPQLGGDTVAIGVVLLLASTVLQRGVGFVREISFCRCLSAEQLGQWDMAFGFLMLAGPLLVMSLPGTFGRYVDRYRQMGQLRSFLRRTAAFCVATAVPAILAILTCRTWFSYLIFGSREHGDMVLLVGLGLLAVIGFNFCTCLFTSLRNVRMVSIVELANSLFFGLFGIGLLACSRATAGAMVVAYCASCLLCVLGSLVWLAGAWKRFPQITQAMPHRELWSRLLPLAAWIMLINFLWNMFDVVDRYMIVHLSNGSPAQALAEVGNYRSSRVLPLLLSSITVMIAGMLLPHLSHEWEAGRRQRVSDQLNLFVKVWSILLTAGAAAVLFVAPLLFHVGFQSKFGGGLLVLPWTLTYCTWFGLTMFLQSYLWCAERASAASLVAFVGVLVNIGLNLILLPRMGLLGAVLATAAANFVVLFMMLVLSGRFGLRVDRGTIVGLLLPMSIPLGPWVVLLTLTAVVLDAATSNRYLLAEEKQEIGAGIELYLGKFGFRKFSTRGRHAEAV